MLKTNNKIQFKRNVVEWIHRNKPKQWDRQLEHEIKQSAFDVKYIMIFVAKYHACHLAITIKTKSENGFNLQFEPSIPSFPLRALTLF